MGYKSMSLYSTEANLTGLPSSVFLIIIIEADAPSHFITHLSPVFIFPLHPSHVPPVLISRFIHHTCHLCSFPASSITRATCVHFPLHDSSAASSITRATCVHFPLHPSHVSPVFISRFIHHTCHLCSFPAS